MPLIAGFGVLIHTKSRRTFIFIYLCRIQAAPQQFEASFIAFGLHCLCKKTGCTQHTSLPGMQGVRKNNEA